MSLSFAEKWTQLRVLKNVSFWLNPQSRSFDASCPRLTTVEQFEKLCGPIRGAHFNEGLLVDAINPALDLAEGILAEYASTLGYKPVDFKFPADYELVTRLDNGDPGAELDLALAVLQALVDGNEAVSKRAEITERLAKLKEAKAKLDNDESELPRIFATLEDRILHCDGVTEEEIEEFTDKIDEEATHQCHLATFLSSTMDRSYLLKGVKHVQFLQKAYQNTTTINTSFYINLCQLMSSVVERLKPEELEAVLYSSQEHCEKVKARKRDYFPPFSFVFRNDEKGQKGVAFAARILLLGPFPVCQELGKHIAEAPTASAASAMASCVAMLHEMPAPLYSMLLEKNPFTLLRMYFTPTVHPDLFRLSMQLLILSNVYPLYKLLHGILLDTVRHYPTFVKIFSSNLLKGCIEGTKPEDWDATVQALIKSVNVVADSTSGVNNKAVKALLEHVATRNGADPKDLTWLNKYGDQDKLIRWIDGEPSPSDPVGGEDWGTAAVTGAPVKGEKAAAAVSVESAIGEDAKSQKGEDEVDGGEEKEEGKEDEGLKEEEEGQEHTVDEVKKDSDEVPQTVTEDEASSTDQALQNVVVVEGVEVEEKAGSRRRTRSDQDPPAIDHELGSIEEEEGENDSQEEVEYDDTEGEFEYDGMKLEDATQGSMNSQDVDELAANIDQI